VYRQVRWKETLSSESQFIYPCLNLFSKEIHFISADIFDQLVFAMDMDCVLSEARTNILGYF